MEDPTYSPFIITTKQDITESSLGITAQALLLWQSLIMKS